MCGCCKKKPTPKIDADLGIAPHMERLEKLKAAFPADEMTIEQQEAMGEFVHNHNRVWAAANILKTDLEMQIENSGIDMKVHSQELSDANDEVEKSKILRWVWLGVGIVVGTAFGVFATK
jgi:hypothetical protein